MNKDQTSFQHYRNIDFSTNVPFTSNMGGATVATADKDGKTYAAVAYCNPFTDNFSRQTGRRISESRLKQLIRKPEIADDNLFFVVDCGDRDVLLRRIGGMLSDIGYTQKHIAKIDITKAA